MASAKFHIESTRHLDVYKDTLVIIDDNIPYDLQMYPTSPATTATTTTPPNQLSENALLMT